MALEVQPIDSISYYWGCTNINLNAIQNDIFMRSRNKCTGKNPRRFLKLIVCKYPTFVNNSEIIILFPKPCPLLCNMTPCKKWPETHKIRLPQSEIAKIITVL